MDTSVYALHHGFLLASASVYITPVAVAAAYTGVRHSLRFPFVRNVEHVAADVHAKPYVAGLLQRFAAETASAPHVQN